MYVYIYMMYMCLFGRTDGRMDGWIDRACICPYIDIYMYIHVYIYNTLNYIDIYIYTHVVTGTGEYKKTIFEWGLSIARLDNQRVAYVWSINHWSLGVAGAMYSLLTSSCSITVRKRCDAPYHSVYGWWGSFEPAMVALFRYVRDLDIGVALKVVDGNVISWWQVPRILQQWVQSAQTYGCRCWWRILLYQP